MLRRRAVIVLLLLAGCQRLEEPTQEAEPPASAIAPIGGAPLSKALELLDRELVAAIRGRLEGDGRDSFLRAEAISDRLLETQYPFRWLRAGSYSVDARLRQVQALADRVLAQLRSGQPRDQVLGDVQLLRRNVLELRQALAQGGGPAPPPLDRLLAGRDTLDLFGAEGPGGE
jgi:hypothetical protein